MLLLELTVSILPVSGIVLAAFVTGFLLRGNQLRSSRRKVLELEKEMLSNHADILELQRDKAILLTKMKESKIPVIKINAGKDEADKTRHAR